MRCLLVLAAIFVTSGAAAQEPKAAARAECERLREAVVETARQWDGQGESPVLAVDAQRKTACATYERIIKEQRQAEEAEEAKRQAEKEAAEAKRQAEEDAARREAAELVQQMWDREPTRRAPPATGPRCKKGKPCGRSCIATWKTCRK